EVQARIAVRVPAGDGVASAEGHFERVSALQVRERTGRPGDEVGGPTGNRGAIAPVERGAGEDLVAAVIVDIADDRSELTEALVAGGHLRPSREVGAVTAHRMDAAQLGRG